MTSVAKDDSYENARQLPPIRLRTARAQLIWLVTACLLPGIIGAVALLYYSYQRERAQLEHDTIQMARALAQAVDSNLVRAEAAVQTLSTSEHLKNGDLTAFYDQARKVLEKTGIGNGFVLSDQNGQQVINTVLPFGAPLPHHGNPGQLRRVFDTGRPVISDIYIGGVLRRPVLSIDVPVVRNGRVVYDLSLGLLPERLGKVLTTQQLPTTWYAAIFDARGFIAARSHSPERYIGKKGAPLLVGRMAEVPEGIVATSTLEGVPVSVAFSRSAVTNWTVAIGIPPKVLTAEMLHRLSVLALAVLALFALAIGMAWIMGERIAGAIRALTAPALALGAGQRVVLPRPTLREAAEVAGAIATAAELLSRRTAERDQAKEAAEAANLAKSQFLANMSHELRTPMTGFLGMLDLSLSCDDTAQQRECIEIARNSGSSLVRILNDILDMTKIETGKLTINEEPFDVRECTQTVFNVFLPVAKSKGIDLDLAVADDVPENLVGDKTRLSQILTNLAANAVKFTEKGEVRIGVTAGAGAPDGKREVIFTVSDTGIGIPDGKKDLIFQPFTQVDESHSREFGGTGLGLAISKQIVERMGGSIGFTSEEGKGSVFSFAIPFGAAASEVDAGVAPVEMAAPGEVPFAAQPRKPRILNAEDDEVTRQVLKGMLERANYQVSFADNGLNLVEMWESGEYDLILMDVQMPQMNGFEAARAIREKERTLGGHVPIIAMTGHALKEDEEKCLAAGMDAFVSKPIDFRQTLQLIGETLKVGRFRVPERQGRAVARPPAT